MIRASHISTFSLRLSLILPLILSYFIVHAQDTIKIKQVPIYGQIDRSIETQEQVIDSLNLSDAVNKDLGEGLQKFSHAFVKSYGIGSLATVSLRGAGSNHTQLTWNGANLNSASNGIVDFSLIPPFFTEEVGLSYGQNSLEYGAGGLGGAVGMKNAIDFSKKEELLLQQSIGSFGYNSSALKVKLGKKKLRSISRLLYKSARNDFEFSDISEEGAPKEKINNAFLEQKGVLQSIHYRPKSSQRVDLHLWYFDSDRELPNMITLRDLEESQYDENLRAQLGIHQYFGSSKLTFNSTYLRNKILYKNNQLEEDSRSLNHSFRNFIQADGEWRFAKFKARLDMDHEISQQESYATKEIIRNRQALFTGIESRIGRRFNLGLSARQELIENDYFFLPQARLDIKLNEGKLNYWIMIGENMKYPSLNDLYWSAGGNADLQAESSQSIEFGQLYLWSILEQHQLKLKTTVYYSHIDNYIQWVPTEMGFWQAENIKEVESKGVEVDLRLDLKGNKVQQQLGFIYNYVSSINLERLSEMDQSVGKQLIYVPEHQYNLNYRLFYNNYSLNANWQFVGARYLLSDNSDYLPYYDLIDLGMARDIKIGNDLLSLGVSLKNLLDVEYQAIQWRPMPGRNYMIELKYRFR